MESRVPIFAMSGPHYSDYGFDDEIDFFQALQQARKHGKRDAKPLDGFRFKLKKPISKDDPRGGAAKIRKRGKWWRRALIFWRRIRPTLAAPAATATAAAAAAAPVYTADGGAGGAWSWKARRRGELKMPYLCLRELAAVDYSSPAAPPPPLYVVS